MDKIIYIGGIGSDAYQVGLVTDALNAQFHKNVVGMSFSEARKNLAHLARLVRGSLVITHSAGLLLLKDTSPREVIAIAPPMPTFPSLLVWRSFPKTIGLIKSSSESSERRSKVLNYHLHALGAHILQPHHNGGMVAKIASFNAAHFAVELVNGGSKVTLAFMENDLLFPDAILHPHLEVAKEYGVKVCDTILGHHDEFVFYPLEVLAQLRQPVETNY